MVASRGCPVTLRNYRKDSTLFWNEFSISPVADNYGCVTHYIGVQKDVTVRVRAVVQLAAANARLDLVNDNASQLVYRDPVTDVFSREHFDYSLKRDWELWQRHGLAVGCLLIAVQPQRSGQESHPCANGFQRELKRVARNASRSFRLGADMVARFSSTELIVVRADVDGSAARVMAENLLAEITSLPMTADRRARGQPAFTTTIGVASVTPNRLILAGDLLSAARNGLRDALASGGNRVGFGLLAHPL
jgi:diguanylate cyclase (GGDEF)-like protein